MSNYTGKQLSSFKFPETQFWINYEIELKEHGVTHEKFVSLDLKEMVKSGNRKFSVVSTLHDYTGVQYGVWLLEQSDEPVVPVYRTCEEIQNAIKQKKIKFV